MTILALDAATVTGWAANRVGETVRSGTITLTAKADRAQRWHELGLQLNVLIARVRPAMLAYERPFLRGHGSMALFGFAVQIELAAYRNSLPVLPISPHVIKKHAGAKTKADILEAAKAKGWPAANEHEADACWLLDYVAGQVARGEAA